MPKKQTTASKKARAAQRTNGGKHTANLRAAQVCGRDLDPWAEYEGTCARPVHDHTEPCSPDTDFDAETWKARQAAEDAAAEARWAAMTPEQQAAAEQRAREDEYDDGRTAADDHEDTRSYKWED